MPVLDKINKAEAKSEELRQNAKAEVSKMLEENSIKNNQMVDQMINDAKAEIKKMNEETQNHLRTLEAQAEEDCRTQNNADAVLAKTHLDETVDFILRKVTDS